ncbi:MAG: TetR/AcrR family transcriptional regulator [Gemmatimonadales bacterium]
MTTMRDDIITAATDLLGTAGLAGWSVDKVADGAGCAKGLIHYHFGSKDTLLAEVRKRVEFQRREDRLTVLGGHSGAAALDALWEVMVGEVQSGRFGAWLDMVRYFGPSTSRAGTADDIRLTTAAARALDASEADLAEEAVVLGAALDGLALRLLQGEPPAEVREGFERVWLGVLS